MPATSRATVVLPVPGLPAKTRCRVMVGLCRPASARSLSTRSTATCRWTSRLTVRQPDQRVELGEQLLHRPGRCGRALLRRRGHGRRCRPPRPGRRSRLPRWGWPVASGGTARVGPAARVTSPQRSPPYGARRRPAAARRRRPRRCRSTRIVGSPRLHAADATSASASRVGGRGGRPGGDQQRSASRSAHARQRRPRTAASKKSWVRPPPRAAGPVARVHRGPTRPPPRPARRPRPGPRRPATPAPSGHGDQRLQGVPSEVTCPVPVLMASRSRPVAAAARAERCRGR